MGTTTVILIAIAIAIVAAVVLALLLRRRSGSAAPASPPETGHAAAHDVAPMTGLESALERVTDRTGRPIRERIDAEAGHVDELRVPDDTGPLLRRALDHVARPGPAGTGQPGEQPAEPSAGTEQADGPAHEADRDT